MNGNRLARTVIVGAGLVTLGALGWGLTSDSSSPNSPSVIAAPVIQTEIVFMIAIVTETPTTGPMATTRPTAPPFQSPEPTWTATPIWMDRQTENEVRTR